MEVPFLGVLRGRKLRKAIAEARGVESKNFGMRQYRGKRKRDGAAVYCIKEGDFADSVGEISRKRDVKETHRHFIRDDEVVGTVASLHARICIPRKANYDSVPAGIS